MWTSDDDMLIAAQDAINECMKLGYMSVGVELQEEAIAAIHRVGELIEQRRLDSISKRDEQAANLAWIIGRYTEAMGQSMSMWVHFKKNEMELAWEALVAAQDRFEAGLRLRYDENLDVFNRNLYALEHLLFPPCLFVSSSILCGSYGCSICEAEYGECDHVSMRLYMGEMCCKVVRDIMYIHHVAIVENPDDKRLRFPVIAGGKDLCSLTYRPRNIPAEEPDSDASDPPPVVAPE